MAKQWNFSWGCNGERNQMGHGISSINGNIMGIWEYIYIHIWEYNGNIMGIK